MEARLGQVEPVHADESFEIGDLSDDKRPEIAPCGRRDKPGAALARAAAGRWHHRVGLAGPRHLAASEVVTVLLQGEHFLRPPLRQVRDEGFEIAQRGSCKLGLIERRRPRADPA
jgi:hypothetical protein